MRHNFSSMNNEQTDTAVSVGAVISSFILGALPYLQFAAVLISIIAGCMAIRSHFKKTKTKK